MTRPEFEFGEDSAMGYYDAGRCSGECESSGNVDEKGNRRRHENAAS